MKPRRMRAIGCVAVHPGAPWFEAALPAAGMVVFALFAHAPAPFGWISAFGLLVTFTAVIWGLLRKAHPLASIGAVPLSSSRAGFLLLGAGYGLVLYGFYCLGNGLAVRVPGLTGFAFVSASIGTSEEVLFRGYIQGRLSSAGALASIALASVLHTAYKTSLFVWTPFPLPFSLLIFSAFTLAGGLGMGILRHASGGVYAPVVAHATFDILVYGGCVEAPWWVWS